MTEKINQSQVRSDPASKRTFDPNHRTDHNSKQPGRADDIQPPPDEIEPAGHEHVRDAGPGQMEDPPKRWSKEDEESDESFPASDPPGNY
ncbi:hypothetical protein V8J36_05470 [Frigidibacter sp. MR17.14]|uniref:hypothetical protein n=1 Tax=Frigidibacter sp. MR17.14 TaxID=3126509 RepID=UPI003012F62A